MYVYPNSNYFEISKTDHPIFKNIENRFWEWLESSNPAMEYEEMYFGEEACYDKKGAILQAITDLLEYAEETGKPVNIGTFDVEASFE